MAAFLKGADNAQKLDFQIYQNGWSNLYWKMEVLEEDLTWFGRASYHIVDFDCSSWWSMDDAHLDFKKQFCFPDYYGSNYAALHDCLSEIDISENGMLVVFRHFQVMDPVAAHHLLDILATHSRQNLLVGRKLLTLVQVDNPLYHIEPVGSCPVLWNQSEWLNSKRVIP